MKIDKVQIENFKSLKYIDIKLSNLTLLTGVNSCGKSSFIQALLLLKQNFEIIQFSSLDEENKKLLNINGDYLQIGLKKDILYKEADSEKIKILLELDDGLEEEHKGCYPIDVEFTSNLKFKGNDDFITNSINYNLLDDNFQYIQTDRISPKISYSLSDEHIQNNLIGTNGEYTAQYLDINRHENIVIKKLIHPNSITEQLLENVSLWLSEITENIEVKADVQQTTLSATLSYIYTYGDNTTSEYSPLSVGFGVTYVLPIIVSILKAKSDDLIIIENPESHLHPAGQSKIAELCAIASANGVQIIIETHSDHFLNGIRIATKKQILKPEDTNIYFFRKDKDELETKIDEINIDKEGGIDSYPKGFFDQMDEDLDKLISW
jgi:predicted ATPase